MVSSRLWMWWRASLVNHCFQGCSVSLIIVQAQMLAQDSVEGTQHLCIAKHTTISPPSMTHVEADVTHCGDLAVHALVPGADNGDGAQQAGAEREDSAGGPASP